MADALSKIIQPPLITRRIGLSPHEEDNGTRDIAHITHFIEPVLIKSRAFILLPLLERAICQIHIHTLPNMWK